MATSNSSNRNRRLAAILAVVACGMVGMSFAAVPLYRVFCQVTGFGGTTQVADAAPDQVLDRTMTIRFEGFIDDDLPWRFKPEQRSVTVKVGEPMLIFYEAENLSERPTAGIATFNVTPLKIGQYFSKVQCFCFSEQVLQPGEKVDMGVSFFVDPKIAEDANAAEVNTITLSYTFFADLSAMPDVEPQAQIRTGTGQGGDGKRQTAALPQ